VKARRSRSLSLVVALSSHLASEVSLEDDGIESPSRHLTSEAGPSRADEAENSLGIY
jgi:hypothetical protein